MSLVVTGSGDCLMPPSPDGPSDHGDQIGHISPCQVPQQFANLGHGQWDAWYLYRFHSRIALGSVLGRDIAILAERIDDDALLTQRAGFDPARFQSGPAKRKRVSPFRRA